MVVATWITEEQFLLLTSPARFARRLIRIQLTSQTEARTHNTADGLAAMVEGLLQYGAI